jgi:cell division protein FtsZ
MEYAVAAFRIGGGMSMNGGPSERLFQHPDVEPRTRMLVMGLGGAGCNMVANIAATMEDGPPVVALNTDAQSLAGCPAPRVLQIGRAVTKGYGANGDTNLGRMAVEESMEAIKELLSGIDILFLVVGLGGGTGSGGAPLILQVAHQLNILTLCFATKPFDFETESRKLQAEEGLKSIQRAADAVVVLPNDKLMELVDPSTGVLETFRLSDEQVGTAIQGLWHLLGFRGVINLDMADLRHLVQRSDGLCCFGFGEGSGPSRIPAAVKSLLDSPYLNGGRSISEAAAVLVNITGGPDLTLADMQGIMAQIKSQAQPAATVYFGAMIDASMRGRVALTAIVTDAHSVKPGRNKRMTTLEDELVAEPGEKKPKILAATDQVDLPFKPEDKGRFSNSTPTTFRGEDLDIPTFIRRGVKLSFER